MQKRTRKAIILLLVLVLAMLSFVGCQNEKATGTKEESTESQNLEETSKEITFPLEEKITLKIVASKHNSCGPYEEMSFFKMLEEETNVHIDWEDIPMEQYNDKKNLILSAANDLPDAFYGNHAFTALDVVKYGELGVFVPIEDYIPNMPNINKVYDSVENLKAMTTAPDGHIYSLPNIRELKLWLSPDIPYINQTWLDKLGLNMPQTMDEFYNVLKAFKENDMNGNGDTEDEIPFTFKYNNDYRGIGSLFGAFGRADWSQHLFVEDGKVVFSAIEPEFKEALIYFNKFVEEGLFDAESFTQDTKQVQAKCRDENDIVGGFSAWVPESNAGVDRKVHFQPIPVLEGPNGDKVWRKSMWNNVGVNPIGFVITSANEYPEITMKWIDYQYETKKSIESCFGPEGVTLEADDTGVLRFKEAPEGLTFNEWVFKQSPVEAPYAILSETYGTVIEQPEKDKLKISQIDELYYDYMTSETYPQLYLTSQENDTISTLQTDILTYINQTTARWLMSGGIEEEWDDYISQLEEMQIQKLIDTYQQAYDRYYENMK